MWPEWLRPILSFQLDLLFYHLSFPVLQPHWPSYSPFRVPGSSASGTLYFQLLESFPPSSPTFICPACPYSAFGPQTTFHFLQHLSDFSVQVRSPVECCCGALYLSFIAGTITAMKYLIIRLVYNSFLPLKCNPQEAWEQELCSRHQNIAQHIVSSQDIFPKLTNEEKARHGLVLVTGISLRSCIAPCP